MHITSKPLKQGYHNLIKRFGKLIRSYFEQTIAEKYHPPVKSNVRTRMFGYVWHCEYDLRYIALDQVIRSCVTDNNCVKYYPNQSQSEQLQK